ncbi:MAG: hypothetical protein ACOZDY_11235 [Pseudomonadota bacterium]
MIAKRIGMALALAAATAVAACDQSPKPPTTPPVPKTETGGGSQQKIFTYERKALERAREIAPAAEDRERDMRERVERQER